MNDLDGGGACIHYLSSRICALMKEANRDVLDRGSLAELLTERARQASDGRLVLEAAVGLVVATLVAIFRPPLWLPVTALATAMGCFGAWGILDREATEAIHGVARRNAALVARAIVASVGLVAGVFGGLTLFFAVLGYWKS